ASAGFPLPGRIGAIHAQGPRVIAHVDVGVVLVVELTPRAVSELALREGTQVYLIVKSNSVLALDALEAGPGNGQGSEDDTT
ncbi:MAG: TOBE domain-containing protein, partial [Chloroflexi bacterium]|nr:TOBE domain-containing protein [Chloroflexota bacterium]